MGEIRSIGMATMADHAAETVILGELLVSDGHPLDCRDQVIEILRDGGPEVFDNPLNRATYQAFLACYMDGRSTNVVSVVAELRTSGDLTEELFDHVHGLPGRAGVMTGADGDALTLLNLYRRRTLHAVLLKSTSTVQSGARVYGELAGEISADISEVLDASVKSETMYTAEQVTESALGHILFGEKQDPGIPMGIPEIDELTGGMRGGQYVVVAGRPGQGKTTLGLQIARNVSDLGIETAIFSLEMGKRELGQKDASAATGVPFEDIRDNTLDAESLERLVKYYESRKDYPMVIDDDPGQTAGEIMLKARKLVKDRGTKLFVIDYVQIVPADNPTGNETQDVASVSKVLRKMARKLDVIVIVLAQLNRESSKREDNIPKLTDLRQSGQIEQDANMALLVHLPFKYDPETERGKEADIFLAKNRGGITAQRVMLFDGAYSRFVNPSDLLKGMR